MVASLCLAASENSPVPMPDVAAQSRPKHKEASYA